MNQNLRNKQLCKDTQMIHIHPISLQIPFNVLVDKPFHFPYLRACVCVCECVLAINPVLLVGGGDALRLYFPLMRS